MGQDQYQLGKEFAQQVQQGLREGKSFDDFNAFTPEEATKIRDIAQKSTHWHGREQYEFLSGYLSQWDQLSKG